MKRTVLILTSTLLTGPLLNAAPMAPNDPSVSGNLLLWLTDATANYSGGTWTDSSLSNDVSNSTVGSGYGGGSSLNASIDYNGITRSAVTIANDGLMGASNINGAGSFSEITIISLYRVSSTGPEIRPVGIGSKTFEGVTGVNFDRLNLATDPTNTTIRHDDGRTDGTYSHGTDVVLRVTRLNAGLITDQFYDTGTGTLVDSMTSALNGSGSTNGTSGVTFSTRTADFYIGELGTLVGGTDSATATTDILEVAVYGTALTNTQVEDISDYIATIPEPSTLVLTGIMLGTLAFFRRRRS